MRFFLKLTAAAVLASALTGQALANDAIKIGVTPGAHEEVMEEVVKVAATKGLDIELVSFSDYVIPNQALGDPMKVQAVHRSPLRMSNSTSIAPLLT